MADRLVLVVYLIGVGGTVALYGYAVFLGARPGGSPLGITGLLLGFGMPRNGHVQCTGRCPLRAKRAHLQLFDQLVCATDQRVRNVEAERLGDLEVHDRLKLGGLPDRQIGRFFAGFKVIKKLAAITK